jgi:hypothetical protein
MDHMVPLQRLPDGLKFPTDLQDRIAFDAAHHRLVFHGFMRKSDYDSLARLSGDLAYLDALQKLFSLCTVDPPARSSHRRKFLWATGALVAVALAVVLGLQFKDKLRNGDTEAGTQKPSANSQKR